MKTASTISTTQYCYPNGNAPLAVWCDDDIVSTNYECPSYGNTSSTKANGCPLETNSDIWTHRHVLDGNSAVSAEHGSEIIPIQCTRNELALMHPTSFMNEYDNVYPRISAGLHLDKYTGNVYEVFENALPPPTKDRSISAEDLEHVNIQLVQAQGYDHTISEREKDDFLQETLPDPGQVICGDECSKEAFAHTLDLVSRDVFNNRAGELPGGQLQLPKREKPVFWTGSHDNFRCNPVLPPTIDYGPIDSRKPGESEVPASAVQTDTSGARINHTDEIYDDKFSRYVEPSAFSSMPTNNITEPSHRKNLALDRFGKLTNAQQINYNNEEGQGQRVQQSSEYMRSFKQEVYIDSSNAFLTPQQASTYVPAFIGKTIKDTRKSILENCDTQTPKMRLSPEQNASYVVGQVHTTKDTTGKDKIFLGNNLYGFDNSNINTNYIVGITNLKETLKETLDKMPTITGKFITNDQLGAYVIGSSIDHKGTRRETYEKHAQSNMDVASVMGSEFKMPNDMSQMKTNMRDDYRLYDRNILNNVPDQVGGSSTTYFTQSVFGSDRIKKSDFMDEPIPNIAQCV
jgi:hypothetical protein